MAKIKVKRVRPNAKLPHRTYHSDAGYDVFASFVTETDTQVEVQLGIAVQPEEGYYIEVVPRSSISKKRLQLANSVGIIDPTYRGEIIMVFNKIFHESGFFEGDFSVKIGEKIGQLIIRKQELVEFEEVKELDETVRGHLGFGSTGNGL
jgi:dUTP pyrophosphatase